MGNPCLVQVQHFSAGMSDFYLERSIICIYVYVYCIHMLDSSTGLKVSQIDFRRPKEDRTRHISALLDHLLLSFAIHFSD